MHNATIEGARFRTKKTDTAAFYGGRLASESIADRCNGPVAEVVEIPSAVI